MRRMLFLFLGLVLTVGIVGCKKEETPETPATPAEPAEPAEPAAP